MMTTEKTPPPGPSAASLRARCSAASDCSGRVSGDLEKLAACIAAERTADRVRTLAGTVTDFVHEMDVLVVLLDGGAHLSDASRRQLGVLASDAEELAAVTATLASRGGEGLGTTGLEKLAETQATWLMMLQLVAAFQSLAQIQDEDDAAQVLDMTASDFDELQRLITNVQITTPAEPPRPEAALPPDYDTLVFSPSANSAPLPAASDHKQPLPAIKSDARPSPSSSHATPSSSSRPKRGKVGGFFRSISSKFTGPIEPLVAALCRAADAGDTDNIRGLLRQGANPEGRDEEGFTPLTSAIHSTTNPDVSTTVRLLLDGGADVAGRDAVWSLPPLWHACRAGRADVAALLIDRGADVRGRNSYGASYFSDAAEKDPPHVVELLLRRGADPDAANLAGRKVVASAVEHNDMTRTRILLDAGASVAATNTSGHSLLAMAVANRNLDMAAYLIDRGAPAAGHNGFGESLVSLAVAPDALDLVRLLLARGGDPDSKSLTGQPCLVSALQQDLPEVTRLLLKHGANASVKDITGRPVLALAIAQKQYEHAALLLEHGADASVAGNRSGSAHLIVTHLKNKSADGAGFLRLMLRHGADPNLMPSSWDGGSGLAYTPLGYCVAESLPELVSVLVTAGADPHRAGETGSVPESDPLGKTTPFRLAAAQGKPACLRAMLEGGAVARLRGKAGIDVDEVLLQAAVAAGENREVVDMLLDEGIERPAWAAAFAEREGGQAIKAAVGERARKLGIEGTWLRGEVKGLSPPPYEGA